VSIPRRSVARTTSRLGFSRPSRTATASSSLWAISTARPVRILATREQESLDSIPTSEQATVFPEHGSASRQSSLQAEIASTTISAFEGHRR